jgi:hypothetical protein
MKMMEFQMKKNQKKDEEEEERKRRARLRGELPPEEQEEDEDWDPECITQVCYFNDDSGQFLVGSTGKYAGYYYRCDFDSARPLEAYEMPKDTTVSQLQFSALGDLLLLGLGNGDVRLSSMLDKKVAKNYISIKQHDGHNGKVTCAKLNFDERFIVTSGADGLIFVHALDKAMVLQESRFDPKDGIEGLEFLPEAVQTQLVDEAIAKFQNENASAIPQADPAVDCMDDSLLAVTLRIPKDVADITDESCYSI